MRAGSRAPAPRRPRPSSRRRGAEASVEISFRGQLALVTGGTRGIGAAIVRALAESGARVVAVGCNAEAPAPSERVSYEQVDLADAASTEAFAARCAERSF